MTLRQAQDRHFGEAAEQLASLVSVALGWTPIQFWESTPRELAAALGLEQAASESVDRNELERLLSRFPDNREQ